LINKIMADINLLPEELRKTEEKESEGHKKPKSFSIELTAPAAEQKIKLVKKPRPSLLSRLFSAKKQKAKSVNETPVAEEPDSKTFHLPETQLDQDSVEVDFTKDLGSDHSIPADEPKAKAEPIRASGPGLFALLRHRSKPAVKAKIKTETERLAKTDEQRVLNVDLIPAELSKYPELELPKKIFSSGLIILAVVLAIGAVYLGMTWYQLKVNNQLDELNGEITSLEKQIGAYESQKTSAIALQKKLEMIRRLLDNHIYWTKFFDLLEKHTTSEVYYTNFSMAGTDKLVLSAVGKDYESVAKQLIAFQQASDFIQEVKIDAASAELNDNGEYSRVTFNINLVLIPEVFKEPIK